MPRQFSAIKVVVAPAKEPVTVAEAKAQLRLLHPDDDVYIGGLISSAREWAEDYTRRAFLTQTIDVQYETWPNPLDRFGDSVDSTFIIPRAPLQQVQSVKYFDNSENEVTLDAAKYNVDLIQDPGSVRVKQLVYGANPYSSMPCLSKNYVNPITIRAIAGYGVNASSVPARIKQAILIMVAHLYNQRTPLEIDVRIVMVQIPFSAHQLLDPFRLRMV